MSKVVLISGASSGLGKTLALRLAQKDYCVYSGMRQLDKSDQVFGIHPVQLDVRSDSSCIAAIEKIVQEQGRIDILINNAGLTMKGLSINQDAAEFSQILDTNLVGSFRMIKSAYPHLKKTHGRIINITSINGFIAMPNFGLYCATKFGLEALGMALRCEIGSDVTVANVVPGAIKKKEEMEDDLASNKIRTARQKLPFLKYLLPMATDSVYVAAIARLVEQEKMPAHLFVGIDAKILYLLHKFLPSELFDWMMEYIWTRQ